MAIGDVFEVEAMKDCYYVDTGMYDVSEYGSVYVLDADRPAIVDTGIGTNYERILDAIREIGIRPQELEAILTTHVHLDHAGGAGFLVDETGADVYVHESGARFLADPGPIWEGTKQAVGDQIVSYTEPDPVPTEALIELEDGDTVDLGSVELDVHRAPGHAFHQIVYHESDDEVVFTADAAGIYIQSLDRVTVTSPPPGFDLEEVLDDAAMIAELDPETLCYAHYGPAPTGDRLSEYETAITEWVESIEAKRSELADDAAVVEYFVERTDLGEVWSETKAKNEVAMNVRGVLNYLDERD